MSHDARSGGEREQNPYAAASARVSARGEGPRSDGWRREVTDSGLPDALKGGAIRVVERARLRRRERAGAAREVVASLTERLALGEGEEELLDECVRGRRAARRLRRRVERARPPLRRAWTWTRRAVFRALVALVLIYVALTLLALRGRPNPSHDYFADVNALAAAEREEDRAWPLYRQALLAPPHAAAQFFAKLPAIPRGRAPEADQREAFGLLEAHADALALLREGAAKPRFGLLLAPEPAEDDREVFGGAGSGGSARTQALFLARAPHLQPLTYASRALAWDALHAAEDGDGRRVVADCAAIVGISKHVAAHPMTVLQSIAGGIRRLAFALTCNVLATSPDALSDEDLLALVGLLRSLSDEATASSLSGERMSILDFIQRVYTDDGRGSGRVASRVDESVAPQLGSPLDSLFIGPWRVATAALRAYGFPTRVAAVREVDFAFAEGEALARTPLWERPRGRSTRVPPHRRTWWLGEYRWGIVWVLMPPFESVFRNDDFVRMERDGAILACSMELFRRREGRWPNALDELVPGLLPRVPIDRFDGQPMRFALHETLGPVVYSVGADLDDDGGIPPAFDGVHGKNDDARKEWRSREEVERIKASPDWNVPAKGLYDAQGRQIWRPYLPDGDWVLFPPIPEPPKKADGAR